MLRVLLKSPLNALTGYGRDGLALACALERAGCHVMLHPISLCPPVPSQVAQMLTRPIEAPFDLLVNHVDPAQLGITSGERKSARVAVAWTMWEWEAIGPQAWEDTLGLRLERFDHLLCYDDTTSGALAPYVRMGPAGTSVPEPHLLQGGYDPEFWATDPRERDWSGPIRFGMAGVLNQRKNPFAAIEAFEEVVRRHPGTELHLKTMDRSLHPGLEDRYEGLHLHYAFWTDAQMREFYRSIHAYVAPSWGEGKNLPAIEAATTGAVPVVSDVGGHRMWASSELAYVVPGEWADLGGQRGVRVDQGALVEAMCRVVTHRAEARQKGEVAARTLPSQMCWDAVVARLLAVAT